MPLTAKEVKNAKPGRLSDGNGLYLLVKPSGSASWVLRVQSDGHRRDFGLGSLTLDSIDAEIPIHKRRLLTLADAREKARIGRALAKAGINPSVEWRQQEVAAPRIFEDVAKETYRQRKKGWRNGKHQEEWLSSLERHAFPEIGQMSVDEVDATAIQKVLLPIWLLKGETARRVKQRIGSVLDYAHAKGWRATEAPMRAVNQLMRSIKQPKRGNYAAMPYKAIPAFMTKLGNGDVSVGRFALRFLILTAARSGEVRKAQWKDIDLDAAEWRMPSEKTKADRLHIVPLVPAALDVLHELIGLFATKPDDLVFPGRGGMMSDATMAKVLRVNGGADVTVHGFRSTFRDWAADTGFADSWAESALAHINPNRTEAAYRRTTFYDQRRDRLMPAWASFALGNKPNVVALAD
ncbi:MAG: integrase arm-type DNA-binding domain-containing protein, partial [Sphingomicrobium sp.]